MILVCDLLPLRNYMNRFLFIISFFLFSNFAEAQLESAHWYFGEYAGLDFSSGTAVTDYAGAMSTGEGCATISDYNGNLLFYTDGSTVWNSSHQIMTNGTGLKGDSSSTQSAIIVPYPEQSSKYYIFTVGADDNINDDEALNVGLHYYIVDMDQSEGLGAVLPFNNISNQLLSLVSEKITAVLHPNRRDYWLITHFQNQFYAYLITPERVQPPVLTTIGYNFPETVYPVNARGYLKASPDGTKLGIAHLSYLQSSLNPTSTHAGNTLRDNAAPGVLAVYDFDDQTGIVSNELILNQENGVFSGSPYGLEFSPDSQLLYAELDYNNSATATWEDGKVIQYQLNSSPVQQTELADGNTLANNGVSSIFKARGALQLALDGKIYYSSTRSGASSNEFGGIALSVINAPNQVGIAADYTHETMTISSTAHPEAIVSYGLPPFVNSFFTVKIILDESITAATICEDVALQFNFETNANPSAISWDFGDGSSSTEFSPSHIFENAGEYNVILSITDEDGFIFHTERTVYVLEAPTPNNTSLQICDIDGDGLGIYPLSQTYNSLISDAENYDITFYEDLEQLANEETPLDLSYSNTVPNQIIWAKVVNQAGCMAIAEVELTTSQDVDRTVDNLEICDEDDDGIAIFDLSLNESLITDLFSSSVVLSAYYTTKEDAANETHPITSVTSYTVEQTETIYVRVEQDGQCAAIVSFDAIVLEQPDINDMVALICPENGELVLDAGAGFTTYFWSGLQEEDQNQDNTQQNITVHYAGTYQVEVSNANGCLKMVNITVSEVVVPQITSVVITNENQAEVMVSPIGNYQYSLNGYDWQDSSIFTDLAFGNYWVYVRTPDLQCPGQAYPFGIIEIPNVITPNGDGINDVWTVPGLDAYAGTTVQVFDRYGKELVNTAIQGQEIISAAGDLYASINETTLWNGYYLGRKVPSTSYWYIIRLIDGRVYKGWLVVKNY